MTTVPDISVITVVRNGEAVIGGCIRSVLSQKIANLEYIIIDGASTDRTLDIIRGYEDEISVCISEADNGLYDAMNKGLRLAKGRHVHFLNSDDRYVSPDALSRVLPYLDEASVCYGSLIYDAPYGKRRLGLPFSWKKELIQSSVPQPTLFVALKSYREVGEFNLTYRIAADYDMVLRLAERFPMRFLDEPITLMAAGGISYTQMLRTFKEAAHVSIAHGRPKFLAYLTYLRRALVWQLSLHLPASLVGSFRRLRGWQ